MKASLVKLTIGALCALVSVGALAMDTTFQALSDNVQRGCPAVWEDPSVPIDDALAASSLFASEQDRLDFTEIYHEVNDGVNPDTGAVTDPVSEAEMAAVLASVDAISFECNAHRKVLLESMLATNSLDSAAALEAALGVADAIDFSSRQWRTGDVRVTGRSVPDNGWAFPTGQSIGSGDSSADLKGDEYKDLFELAKTWHPNQGTETWGAAGNDGVVILPDMRGRTLYAADNMGGQAADVIADNDADVIGGALGQAESVIQVNQMPSHTHAMNSVANHQHSASNAGNHSHSMGNAGAHGHTMGYGGVHGHRLRSSAYNGSGAPRTDWPYFEGRARPNYQNLIGTASVEQSGNHKHSLSNAPHHKHSIGAAGAHGHTIGAAGGHTHTNSPTGGSTPFNTVSPGLVFNIEIKL